MTIKFFDTTFYDNESGNYSDKRYNTEPRSYTQFFFQERLRHVSSLVTKYKRAGTNLTLIEDGCADGIVAQRVYERNMDSFSKVIGTDISPGMIEAAKARNKISTLSFSLKKDLSLNCKADVLLAVGFVSTGIFVDEFAFIDEHLKDDGIIILSLAAKNSLYARFKLRGKEIVNDYQSFRRYESYLSKEYKIIAKKRYGFFVPKLWAFPILARGLQPIFEVVGKITPRLFHETLYVLEKRG